MVFTVEKAFADDLAKAAADYRMKDVFGFRAYTGTRLEVARGGAHSGLRKEEGAGEGRGREVDAWCSRRRRSTTPRSTISATKVAGLRAESFVDALPKERDRSGAHLDEVRRGQEAGDGDALPRRRPGVCDAHAMKPVRPRSPKTDFDATLTAVDDSAESRASQAGREASDQVTPSRPVASPSEPSR